MSKSPDEKTPEEKDHQETVALSRREMGISSGKTEPETAHQETVALSRAEMGLADKAPEPPAHQHTVALSREEMGIAAGDQPPEPETAHQETVALSRIEMGVADKAPASESHLPAGSRHHTRQETMALSREDMGIAGEDRPPVPGGHHQETVALSRSDMGVDDEAPAAGGHSETVVLSREEMGVARGPKPAAGDTDDFRATSLERKHFDWLVRKDFGDRKYDSLGKLVEGGMGAILRVQELHLQRILAMKVVRPAFKSNAETLRSFITEAKITGMLEHPNIIPIHELGIDSETGLYFTMKLAEGEALIDILDRLRDGDPDDAARFSTYQLLTIFRKVCDALSFAHSKRIIHQDIKPHNIIVGPYGEVLLMDWGLARYVGDPSEETDPETAAVIRDVLYGLQPDDDLIKGSPSYISPEQVIGTPLDERSDIFLLGATLYHIFTLETPYSGQEVAEVLQQARTASFIPPEHRSPGRQIPAEVCRIIKTAMALDPADRYPDVASLAAEIDDIIAGKWTRQEKKSFAPGELLMKEGETGEEAYLILSGRVDVVKETDGEPIVLGSLTDGDIVGEMSLIARVTRSASVRAVEATEAAILTQSLLSQNLRKLPPYMEKIVSTLTDRLRTANANIHPYAAADPTPVVAKQLRLLFLDRFGAGITTGRVGFEEISGEIARDLGLATARVRETLERLAEDERIAVEGDAVTVPHPDRLSA